MSKIGKKPIEIPSGVSIKFEGSAIVVAGPRGSLTVKKPKSVALTESGSTIVLQPSDDLKQTIMDWGTTRSLIQNAIEGVTTGFVKKLELEGVGFKVSIEGNELVLKVGFSHLVRFSIPKDVSITVEKNIITVSGNEKQIVGQTAAVIRKIKKPEPYLGKGIRYQGEVIRRKDGKKAGAAAK